MSGGDWARPPAGRVVCGDCRGACVVEVRHENESGRSRWVEFGCAECGGVGHVPADPLDGVDVGPDAEPDAVPVSFVEAAMLAAELGGVSERTLLDAVRVLRTKRAA